MVQKMFESCSKRCGRGSMCQPTTHRFQFPRGTKRSLRSRFLSCSVAILNVCLQAFFMPRYLQVDRPHKSLPPPDASNIYFTVPLGNLSSLPFLYFSYLGFSPDTRYIWQCQDIMFIRVPNG